MSRLLAVLVAASLAACGMKGNLVVPPGPVPEPLLGKTKSAPQAQPANGSMDVSTTPQTPRPQ